MTPKQKKPPDKLRHLRVVGAAPDADALLERLEDAVLRGDQDAVVQITGALFDLGQRVAEVLTQRLIAGRTRVAGLAFEMLVGFAGPDTPKYLQRIAGDANASSIVRFGAQRRLGWPERGEAKRRLAFLDSLKDPESTLLEATAQGLQTEIPNPEVLEEVLGYLRAMPVVRRLAFISRLVESLDARLSWLLRGVIHLPDSDTQRLALDVLVKHRDPGSAGAIARLAKTARRAAIRAEAAAALQRLALAPVGGKSRAEPLHFPPLRQAYLSTLDGQGGQVALVARRWDDDVYLVIDIFHNDLWGLKNVWGLQRGDEDQALGVRDGMNEEGIPMVEVDLPAIRGALSDAVEVNALLGHAIPPAFEIWEPFAHESYPPPGGEPVVVPALSDAPFAGRADLVRGSARLAAHEFFTYWDFDPEALLRALAAVAPPRRGRLTDKQYRPLVPLLMTPTLCAQWRRRLQKQAWLLDRSGDAVTRDLALAVAAEFANGPRPELAELPFLREAIDRAIAAFQHHMSQGPDFY